MMSIILEEQNVYAGQFSALLQGLPGHGVSWLDHLRKRGMEDFLALGFPTTKLENWKYTNVTPIRRITFQPASECPYGFIPETLRVQAESYNSPRLVFVNGRFDQRLSAVGALDERPDGYRPPLQFLRLSQALRDPQRAIGVEKHLGRYTSTSENAFAAWNTAFFTDGAYIEIPRGLAFERPIHLVFVSVGTGEPWACYPRNLIVAGEGSQVTFVESFLSLNGPVYLTNMVTEIVAEAGAVIEYYKVERESHQGFHTAAINAHLERDASLTSHSISLGGALVRNDLNVALDGEGSHCTLNGLFAVDGQRLVDNHTRIDHLRSHASSRELYKGVLAGKAEGEADVAARQRIDVVHPGIAPRLRDAAVRIQFDAVHALSGDDVDDSSDGIRAVNRRAAVLEDFNPLYRRRRNRVQVDDGRRPAPDAAGDHPLAIDKHQRAL